VYRNPFTERPGCGPFAIYAKTVKRRNVYRACAGDLGLNGKPGCSKRRGKESILDPVGITNPSVSMTKHVATAGESFPSAIIDLVVDQSDSSRLKLLLWDGTKAKVAAQIKYGCRTYEPVAVDPTVVRGVRWPTCRCDCGSTRELFDRILGLITRCTGVADQPARLLAYFIFSTWFPDRLTVVPGVAILSPTVSSAIQLLRLLHRVCRRSILLGGTPQHDLISLPLALSPSLLIDRPTLTRSLRSFLSTSNRRGLFAARRGKILDVCCPKVVYFGMGEVPEAIASGMLRIALPPTAVRSQVFDDGELNAIATELQGKMLAYRLANFANIQVSELPGTNFTDQTRELAVNLAACVIGDCELARGVVPLLKEQDEYVRGQRDRELETVVIEAVLVVVHERKKDRVQVKEIASLANSILRSRGEFIEYSPEEVGHRLDILRLQRTRGAAGMCLILTSDMRRFVHRLARTYDVPSVANVVSGCRDCKAASGPASTIV
jgi:hypothetical protein